MIHIENKKDPSQVQTLSDEHWQKMIDRGDSRNWKVLRRVVDIPSEITTAFTALGAKKKPAKPAPEVGEDIEND